MSASWNSFSQKLVKKILGPRCSGRLNSDRASAHQMRLVESIEGAREDGGWIALTLLVDEQDGTIVDAKFHCYGKPALIGLAEAACEILIRKNYDQASRITADFIERSLRDSSQTPAIDEASKAALQLIIRAIVGACQSCLDIPIEIHSPVENYAGQTEKEYPQWSLLTYEEKMALIEGVIASEIRPYVELDEGDVVVIALKEDREVIIGYKGACTTCYSATGSTLDAIQGILRARVHPALLVTPDLSLFPAAH